MYLYIMYSSSMKQKVFTATEARQRFFEVLKLAEHGETPLIIKKDSNLTFEVNLSRPKKDIEKLLSEMGEIGLKVGTPEEIKKILVNRSDIEKNVTLR